MTSVPDVQQLAQGRLALLSEDHPDYDLTRMFLRHRALRLADDSTWRQWRRFRWVELWQAVALQLFLDPDTVRWHTLGVRHRPHRTSIGQLFGERIQLAIRHIEHESLPIVAEGEHPRRAKVRPWEYASWCDDIGLPCPEQMLRVDPKASATTGAPTVTRAPSASPEYLRLADLIPALVPFSPATLWRYVKSGKFPAPIKVSASITAWRRSDYEAWVAAQSPDLKPKRKPRSN